MNESIQWIPVPGAGSDRRYFRGFDSERGVSVLRAFSPDVAENRSFIGLAEVFRSSGVNVPEVYEVAEDEKSYILEDFGSVDLFSRLGSEEFESLAADALRALVRIQTVPEDKWAAHVMYPPFSVRQAMYDLNYFKYCFLKPSGVAFDEEKLEDELEQLARSLAEVPEEESGFMYRDFQSRNIMVSGDKLGFIDFQGGRKGPVLYDAVSFLWQAKAALPAEMKDRLVRMYADEYEHVTGVKAETLLSRYSDLVLFRTLQVLGAYGMRGLTQRRSHFLRSISSGLANLKELIAKGLLNSYPVLKKACEELCALERFSIAPAAEGKLTIQVYSFSYKKGYPDDFSGNGGGFMFDCRALHNPGRYDQYKMLSGRDESVISFLEERSEVRPFLKTVESLVFPSVTRYLKRGFTSLQVGFGCTGGQHRSVYCAEHFAKSVKEQFPEVIVDIIHREQNIREKL